MTTPPRPVSQPGAEALASGDLEAFIAYEDLPSGLAARRCLEHLSRDLGTDARLTLWRLDLLKERELVERTVRAAASADLGLLSLASEDSRQAHAETPKAFTTGFSIYPRSGRHGGASTNDGNELEYG